MTREAAPATVIAASTIGRGPDVRSAPRLPREWRRLRFRIEVRGQLIVVDKTPEATAYRLLEGRGLPIEHFGGSGCGSRRARPWCGPSRRRSPARRPGSNASRRFSVRRETVPIEGERNHSLS